MLAAKPAAFVSFTEPTPGRFRARASDFKPHYRQHRGAAATPTTCAAACS